MSLTSNQPAITMADGRQPRFQDSRSQDKVFAKQGSQIKREQGPTGENSIVQQLQHVVQYKMDMMEAKMMAKLQNIETRIYNIGLKFGTRLKDMQKKMNLNKKKMLGTRGKVRKVQKEADSDEDEDDEKMPPKQKNDRVGDYYWTLDQQERLEAVAAVKSGLKSKMQVALQYGKSLRTIKRWVSKYA